MGVEIERKYLVDKEKFNKAEKTAGEFFRQGYIFATSEKSVRVRVTEDTGFLTIKGKTQEASRPEYEYEIGRNDAVEMLDLFAESEIIKKRYSFLYYGNMWEVDVFEGDNEGLILAEIELKDEEQVFEVPEWVSAEVTGDERYYNSNLSKNPYNKW